MATKILEVRQYHITQVPQFIQKDWSNMIINDEHKFFLGNNGEKDRHLLYRKDRYQRVSVWRSDGQPVIYP